MRVKINSCQSFRFERTIKNGFSLDSYGLVRRMEYLGIIYAWTCKSSGLTYIGLSRSSKKEDKRKKYNSFEKIFDKRRREHMCDSKNKFENSVFHKAIKKYGFEDFVGKIILTFEADTYERITELVNDAEFESIKTYDTIVPNGYNLQCGGNSPIFHDDTCVNMSLKKQEFLNTESGKQWILDVTIRQQSHFQTEKGREQALTHGTIIKNLYAENPEIRSEISKTLLKFFKTEEGIKQLEKQSKFMKDFYETPEGLEQKKKLSEDAKLRWQNQQYRQKQIDNGNARFEGHDGENRKDNLRNKAAERFEGEEGEKRRELASQKITAHFDMIGRVSYECLLCGFKPTRDKHKYTKHINTNKHLKRSGM